jgi:hypothetical protein
MMRPTAISFPCILAAALCIITSCGGMSLREEQSWKAIPVFNFKTVAGKWEGIVVGSPPSVPAKDWVRLNIFATGIYEVANRKMIQVFDGSGTFVLTQGKLVSQSQTGNIVLWLLSDEKSGERIIHVDAVGNAGDELSARLKRTSEFPLPLQRRSSDK